MVSADAYISPIFSGTSLTYCIICMDHTYRINHTELLPDVLWDSQQIPTWHQYSLVNVDIFHRDILCAADDDTVTPLYGYLHTQKSSTDGQHILFAQIVEGKIFWIVSFQPVGWWYVVAHICHLPSTHKRLCFVVKLQGCWIDST